MGRLTKGRSVVYRRELLADLKTGRCAFQEFLLPGSSSKPPWEALMEQYGKIGEELYETQMLVGKAMCEKNWEKYDKKGKYTIQLIGQVVAREKYILCRGDIDTITKATCCGHNWENWMRELQSHEKLQRRWIYDFGRARWNFYNDFLVSSRRVTSSPSSPSSLPSSPLSRSSHPSPSLPSSPSSPSSSPSSHPPPSSHPSPSSLPPPVPRPAVATGTPPQEKDLMQAGIDQTPTEVREQRSEQLTPGCASQLFV